jgi:hypothetical protein
LAYLISRAAHPPPPFANRDKVKFVEPHAALFRCKQRRHAAGVVPPGGVVAYIICYNAPDPGHFADYPPQVVLQALLASNLTSITEFAFGVVRPGMALKPNWHFEAVT